MLEEILAMVGNYESRSVGYWCSELDKSCMLSTALVTDGVKPFESAMAHPSYNGGQIIILEAYDTKEQAQAGHEKYLAIAKADGWPDEITERNNSEVGLLLESLDGFAIHTRQRK